MLAMRGTSSSNAYGTEITTWPQSTASSPSEIVTGPFWNRISIAMPSTSSGTTSGSSITAVITLRPRKVRRAIG
jgi:hypothetical protein